MIRFLRRLTCGVLTVLLAASALIGLLILACSMPHDSEQHPSRSRRHRPPVFEIVPLHDGESYAAIERSGGVSVGPISDRPAPAEIPLKGIWANCLALSPADGRILIGGLDGSVLVCSPEEQAAHATVLAKLSDSVQSVAFSPDGQWVAAVDHDGRIGVWDSDTGAAISRLTVARGCIDSLGFTCDSQELVARNGDGTLIVVEPRTGRTKTTIRCGDIGHGPAVCSPTGSFVAWAGRKNGDPVVQLWDLRRSDVPVWEAGLRDEIQLVSTFHLAYSPDGGLLACAYWETIALLDVSSGDVVAEAIASEAFVTSLSFLTDGNALLSSHADGTVRRWSTPDLVIHGTIRPPNLP